MNSDWKKKIPDWIPADRSLVGVLITLLFVVVAIYLGYVLWMLYMRSPWTRDAFVRAEVADIATEGVSGYVTAIYVKDNQKVQAGDPLFDIDPTRYQFAVKEAEAQFETAKKKLVLQTSLARMRVNAQGAVSVQDKQIYDTEAAVAQDAVDNAKAALDLAKYNLYRTRVLAPCDGDADSGGPPSARRNADRRRRTSASDEPVSLARNPHCRRDCGLLHTLDKFGVDCQSVLLFEGHVYPPGQVMALIAPTNLPRTIRTRRRW
jgi:multidrug efflux pump subunit AcrA (membrane-fusion protein)